MNTTIATRKHATTKAAVIKEVKAESTLWKKAEAARFGILPMLLVTVVCIGSIAMAFGTGYEVLPMLLVTLPAVATLSFTLAVGPMRLIIWSAIISVAADLLVFVI